MFGGLNREIEKFQLCTLSREKVSISLDKDEKRDIPFHSHEVKVLFFGTYNHFLAFSNSLPLTLMTAQKLLSSQVYFTLTNNAKLYRLPLIPRRHSSLKLMNFVI